MDLDKLFQIKPEPDNRPHTDKGILEDGEGYDDEDEDEQKGEINGKE